jgi:hypothetical protein
LTALVVMLVLSIVTAGCSGKSTQANGLAFAVELAPLAEMPAMVHEAPVAVQEAYRFAVANPDVLSQIPCYCGCGSMGHTSNLACFVADRSSDGSVTFDEHALGCSICVDIAQDAMRMLGEGNSVEEIFTYVDSNYSRFGPPTQFDP